MPTSGLADAPLTRRAPRTRARRRGPRPCRCWASRSAASSIFAATESMKRHCRTERLDRADLVLGVRVQVEPEPLAADAVAAAAQLERELERLHERRRADHVVVVERAPAGVGVLVAEQALGGEQRGVLGQVLAVHQQVLPVHVDLDVVEALGRGACATTYRHMPMLRIRIFIAGSEFLCSRNSLTPCSRADLGRLAHALDQPPPRIDVGRLERVVVALAAGPDDQVRAERAGELAPLAHDPPGLGAQLLGRG